MEQGGCSWRNIRILIVFAILVNYRFVSRREKLGECGSLVVGQPVVTV